jgi:hypothetical protein
MAAGDSKARKVESHPLVQALNPDPAKPPQRTVKLFGLPGASSSADHTRLWLDADLTSYADVPDEAILHSKTLPDDAGTVLWVAADAKLSHGSVSSHATQAGFLAGSITATHLAGAAPAGAGLAAGPMPTPPVTAVLPCTPYGGHFPSLPICPSEAMAPSHCFPCPSHTGPCLSLPFCRTETCPPSRLGPCITQLLGCGLVTHVAGCPPSQMGPCMTNPVICQPLVSQIWVCQPTHFGPCQVTQTALCQPTHAGPCPSVHVICPTPTALLHCQSLSCPTRVCPSSATPCQTGEACPSALCPPQSLACGGPGGGFGPAE